MLGSLFADRYRASNADIAKQVSDGYQLVLMLYKQPLTSADLDKVIWKAGHGKAGEYMPGFVEKGHIVVDEITGIHSLSPDEFKATESFLRLTGLKGVVEPVLDMMLGAKDTVEAMEEDEGSGSEAEKKG